MQCNKWKLSTLSSFNRMSLPEIGQLYCWRFIFIDLILCSLVQFFYLDKENFEILTIITGLKCLTNINALQFMWIFEIRDIELNCCRFILIILFHCEVCRYLNDVWSRFTTIFLLETIKYLTELILIYSETFSVPLIV